ncbi:MAG: hypothetical protein R2857_14690 [Vampirovibrionales bacterium]
MWLIPDRFGIERVGYLQHRGVDYRGWPHDHHRAVKAFGLGSLTMDTLVSVGTLSAWGV